MHTRAHKRLQAASRGELAQALEVGFPPERVVFDSPAKTRAELEYALSAGVAVNMDNFQVGACAYICLTHTCTTSCTTCDVRRYQYSHL